MVAYREDSNLRPPWAGASSSLTPNYSVPPVLPQFMTSYLIFDNISIHTDIYTQPTKSISRSVSRTDRVGFDSLSVSSFLRKMCSFPPSSSIRAETFPHPYWHVGRYRHYADFTQASTLLRFHGGSFLVCLEDTSSSCLILTAKGSVALTPLH